MEDKELNDLIEEIKKNSENISDSEKIELLRELRGLMSDLKTDIKKLKSIN